MREVSFSPLDEIRYIEAMLGLENEAGPTLSRNDRYVEVAR